MKKGLLVILAQMSFIHAVMDALLGAAALGVISASFPDSDERYKDFQYRAFKGSREDPAGKRIYDRKYRFHRDRPEAEAFAVPPADGGKYLTLGIEKRTDSVKATTEEAWIYRYREDLRSGDRLLSSVADYAPEDRVGIYFRWMRGCRAMNSSNK